jgi:hypothetical protein
MTVASGFFFILAMTVALLPPLTPEESGPTARAASITAGRFFFSLLPIGLEGWPRDRERVSMIREDRDYEVLQSESYFLNKVMS